MIMVVQGVVQALVTLFLGNGKHLIISKIKIMRKHAYQIAHNDFLINLKERDEFSMPSVADLIMEQKVEWLMSLETLEQQVFVVPEPALQKEYYLKESRQ